MGSSNAEARHGPLLEGDLDCWRLRPLPRLLEAGAERINLLAFDNFGTPGLGHHALLRHAATAQDPRSADAAVRPTVANDVRDRWASVLCSATQ